VGEILSEANRRMLWVPRGFAHGFYVTGEQAEFVYKCTDFYAPEHERCIVWNDPDIGIEWPHEGREPLLSNKDQQGNHLADADIFT
jgi:dTDP-4-dehydrorhamnose 3,5-epimerase